jgi:nucleotide-binding universal stress UspA family protein
MAPFDRILLCYDGTSEGRAALRCGALLARELQASTHLLAILDHSYWTRGFEILSPVAFDLDDHAAEKILKEGVATVSDWGVTTTGHVLVGNPIDEISKLARELDIDLIVIGHRHGSAFMRWWTGENHALLLDRVNCGVLFEIGASPNLK